jgi:ribosomal protein L37E
MEFALFLAGALLSWLITHLYHRHSSKQAPEWADEWLKGLIEKLPDTPPTKERLLELVQEYLKQGNAVVNEPAGHIACPECANSAENFEQSVCGDDSHTIVITSCPACGWSQSDEV